MEKEHLSQAFIMKYEPLSDSFVVVKKQNDEEVKREPFSLFRNKARTRTMMDDSAQTTPRPPENLPPRPEQPSSVALARDAYNRMKIISSLYQTMAISDQENAELYTSLANEMLILENSMLSIYTLLSGNNFAPAQTLTPPPLTGNLCTDLSTIQAELQQTIDTVIDLQKSVNVDNINRQLAIISASLFSQQGKLNALKHSFCGAKYGE